MKPLSRRKRLALIEERGLSDSNIRAVVEELEQEYGSAELWKTLVLALEGEELLENVKYLVNELDGYTS